MKIHTERTISAAHFVHSDKEKCSRLHGHNWLIEVFVEGKPEDGGMVLNFNKIKSIIDELDHKTLIPSGHNSITIRENHPKNYDIYTIQNKFYSLPKEDCVILPIAFITVELLSKHLWTIFHNIYPNLSFKIKIHETKNNYSEA